jgi:hypothetical protein
MSVLTDNQIIALTLLGAFSSTLSILGSLMIIYMLSKSKRQSVYNRIMFGMSFFDIINSFSFMIAPFILPESGGRKWAFGNDHTCSVLGFFSQIGNAVPCYIVSLTTYFLLTIVFGMNESRISRCIEPTFHFISIIYPLITASIGVGLALFSELELGLSCWIGEYPKGCDEDPEIACISTIIGWIYSGFPLVGSLIFLIISNAMIYLKVRNTTQKSKRFSIDLVIARNVLHITQSELPDSILERNAEICDNQIGKRVQYSNTNELEQNQIISSKIRNTSADDSFGDRRKEFSSRGRYEMIQREEQRSPVKSNKNREVAMQASRYIFACFCTVSFMIALRIVESCGLKREEESQIIWLTFLAQLTYPLHGFWSLLIFVRPKYVRWRQLEPNLTRFWALKQSLSSRNPCSISRRRLSWVRYSSEFYLTEDPSSRTQKMDSGINALEGYSRKFGVMEEIDESFDEVLNSGDEQGTCNGETIK